MCRTVNPIPAEPRAFPKARLNKRALIPATTPKAHIGGSMKRPTVIGIIRTSPKTLSEVSRKTIASPVHRNRERLTPSETTPARAPDLEPRSALSCAVGPAIDPLRVSFMVTAQSNVIQSTTESRNESNGLSDSPCAGAHTRVAKSPTFIKILRSLQH